MSSKQTIFEIKKMDCPSEERLIRMALDGVEGVKNLKFDLGARQLIATHAVETEKILEKLLPLGLGASVLTSKELSEVEEIVSAPESPSTTMGEESRVLKQLLAINGTMFVLELFFGLLAQSTGLISDSLDMFADAAVYGLSLYAVGKAVQSKKRAAKFSGYLQLFLALGAAAEILRRLLLGSEPEPSYMMGVASLALIANVTCLLLMAKHRNGEIHMKASWIFSTNDVIANALVIVAGLVVWLTGSRVPDIVIGAVITAVVFSGAMRILKLARA